jgi:hypothetical protein
MRMIMTNDKKIRYIIISLWVVSFILIFSFFNIKLSKKEMVKKLDIIEERVNDKDWEVANKEIKEFTKLYAKNKNIIHINNASESLVNFEYTIGQLENSVIYKREEALEYIGALKYTIEYIMQGFSGP